MPVRNIQTSFIFSILPNIFPKTKKSLLLFAVISKKISTFATLFAFLSKKDHKGLILRE